MAAPLRKVSRLVRSKSEAQEARKTYYMSWREKPRELCDGWYIQIPYSRDGKRLWWRQLISKAHYSGTKTSLKRIALRVRNRMMKKLRVSDPSLVYHHKKSRRNTSGLVGVRLTEEGFKGSGYWHWEARWATSDRKVARNTFSVALYGWEDAKRLATAAREKALRTRREAAKACQ